MPERIVERSQWHTPKFLAVRSISDKTEILEEYVGILAIRGRRGGCRAVRGTFDYVFARPGSLTAPEDSPRAPVQGKR